MLYEVYIPSADRSGEDVTMTVDAENWMQALKSGLQRTGEANTDIRNVMCDIKEDNTIHVTDAMSRRVFVLKELPEGEGDATFEEITPVSLLDSGERSAVRQDFPVMSSPSGPVAALRTDTGDFRIGSSDYKALRLDEGQAPRVVREERQPSQHDVLTVGRGRASTISESILEDIFLEIQSIHEKDMAMEEVVHFVMDMAMEKVPAESGAILFADVNGQELYFATARGPKAEEVMQFRVPMGIGLAGFCAREGVSLAVSDAQNDARFYHRISQSLNYPTQSIVCAPIQYEGRVYGCVELMNRAGGSHFSSHEVNALTYIGNQFAIYVNRLIMSREKL